MRVDIGKREKRTFEGVTVTKRVGRERGREG